MMWSRPNAACPDHGNKRSTDGEFFSHIHGRTTGCADDADILPRETSAAPGATFGNLVFDVVFGGAKKQMVGSDAWRIVAGVQDVQSWGNIPVRQNPGDPVCSTGFSEIVELSVPGVFSVGCPKPTVIRYFDLAPEPLDQRHSMRHNFSSHRSAPTDRWSGTRSGRATACRVLLLYHSPGRNEGQMSCAV